LVIGDQPTDNEQQITKTKFMIKFIVLISFTLMSLFFNAQIDSSSCVASDSVTALYKVDAQRMALRKIVRRGLSFKDSVEIPQSHSDTVLKALVAVYNAVNLPARHEVITAYNIHSIPDYNLNVLNIAADSTRAWMDSLQHGNVPTGNYLFDSLFTRYHFQLGTYYNISNLLYYHYVSLVSDSNYNIAAILPAFNSVAGVYYTETENVTTDGNDIKDSIFSDHVQLVYSYGWGDCLSGCTERAYWKFNVYYDCTVEFVSKYGDELIATNFNSYELNNAYVFPNPFRDFISVKGFEAPFTYSIMDLNGKILAEEKAITTKISLPEKMESGFYLLRISNASTQKTFKIIRG
jgi:hypothetical protein